jgi:DNA primase
VTEWIDFAEVRAKVSLEAVLLEMYGLGDRLKRQGKKLFGPCPIHQGDSPRAFQVDLEKNVYFCFSGCRKGGNAIDFVVR